MQNLFNIVVIILLAFALAGHSHRYRTGEAPKQRTKKSIGHSMVFGAVMIVWGILLIVF